MAAVAAAPKQLFNWNLTEASTPAVVARAKCIEDVQRILSDKEHFPSPVLAVGALHSVNACITNSGGTMLNMSDMNAVLGLESHGVRVQAGCKMADIYDWLGKNDLETSFCPEIGDATVGSLVVTTSKDSSIDGPGYLSAIVAEAKYVDENGQVITLLKSKHPAELAAFTCSYGMMGIVVEAVLEVRQRIPVVSAAYTPYAADGAAAVAHVKAARAKNDALFCILVPDRNYIYLEARKKANKAGAMFARNRAVGAVGTVGVNEFSRMIMVNLKYNCFLNGDPVGRKMALLLRANFVPVIHYRNLFTNRYPEIQPGTRRLDFSYFEFNLPSLDAVLEGCWNFHKEFKAKHGFGPRGYAIYFVNRGYQQQEQSGTAAAAAGAPKADIVGKIVGVEPVQQQQAGAGGVKQAEGVLTKPYGNYSKWGPGVSFMMDPITDDADSPLWVAFNEAYTAWAVSMGAIPSLSQTKGLKPGQVTLPQHLTRERFLTPYYKAFVA